MLTEYTEDTGKRTVERLRLSFLPFKQVIE